MARVSTDPGNRVRKETSVPNAVDNAFQKFDDALKLDPQQLKQAQDRHKEIRELLQKTGQVSGSFLQGSFARKTMLKPLKDVDIVILLNKEAWPGIEGPNGPARAMKFFREQIARRWPTAVFDGGDDGPAGRALRVEFDDVDFYVDLVPALAEPDSEVVRIGDRKELRWVPSLVRRENRLISERNVETHNAFVRQVRMVKAYVRRFKDLDFLAGIVVESLLYATVKKQVRHVDALVKVFTDGAIRLNGPVRECTGTEDVTARWSSAQRSLAVKAFADAAKNATDALRLEHAGDHAAAIAVWHDILGEEFPRQQATKTEDEVMRDLSTGSLTGTGRTSAKPVADAAFIPSRAWRSR